MTDDSQQAAALNAERLTLFGYFSGDKYLTKYFQKLGNSDIYTVGDLAKTLNVFESFPTTDRNKKRIVDGLSFIGFDIK